MGNGFIITHRGKSKEQLHFQCFFSVRSPLNEPTHVKNMIYSTLSALLNYGLQYVSRKWLYSPGHADLRRLRVAQTAQTPEKGHFEGVFVC